MKSCPLCGHEPEIKFIMVDEPVTNFDKYYEVYCPICKQKGIRIRHTIQSLVDNEEHKKAKEYLASEWDTKVDHYIP